MQRAMGVNLIQFFRITSEHLTFIIEHKTRDLAVSLDAPPCGCFRITRRRGFFCRTGSARWAHGGEDCVQSSR